MHGTHLCPKFLSCTSLQPRRVFREAESCCVLTPFLRLQAIAGAGTTAIWFVRTGKGERNKNKTCKNRNQRSLWLEFLLRWWRCAVCTSALLEALPVRYYSLHTVDSGLESIYWETCSWGEWCEGVHSKQGS